MSTRARQVQIADAEVARCLDRRGLFRELGREIGKERAFVERDRGMQSSDLEKNLGERSFEVHVFLRKT